MQLEKFITPLLFRYHCVVVPGFGAFLSHEKGASHHVKNNSFYPPTKVLSFNARLQVGDGILVAHIAASLSKTYEESLIILKEEVQKWTLSLKEGNAIDLEGLGILENSKGGHTHFTPYHQANYLPASFGLSAVKVLPIAASLSTQQRDSLGPMAFELDPSHGKNFNLGKVFLKYAAAGLIGVSSLLSIYKSYDFHLENKVTAQQEAQEIVSQKIQEATFFGNNPLSFSALEINLTKKEEVAPSFFIIAGAFRDPDNASIKIADLKSKGFENASYLGANRYGLHQVSFASFITETDARVFLRDIHKNFAQDAWILMIAK